MRTPEFFRGSFRGSFEFASETSLGSLNRENTGARSKEKENSWTKNRRRSNQREEVEGFSSLDSFRDGLVGI